MAEGDGANGDPLTMANRASIKRLTMDVLLNLLVSQETSEGYKKLVEEGLKRRERRGLKEIRMEILGSTGAVGIFKGRDPPLFLGEMVGSEVQMSEKKVVGKNVVISLGIICTLLAVGLVVAIVNYTSIVTSLNSQVSSKDSQISSLNSTVTTLQSQVSALTAIINMSESKNLKTLVFHVEESYTGHHIPDVSYTYNQILAVDNNMHNVLLNPEYEGNRNWTETLAWLTANFGGQHGIPIMLDVFGGGPHDYPVPKLSTNDILEAMAVCNVEWLRFNEVVSWHMEHNLSFPTDYVTTILNFCKEHNLRLFWSEWKVDNVFQTIQTYIMGFEDIVTVAFSTNSGDLEPADGFMLVSTMFQHWGGSVQAWYWPTRYGSNPLNMPISLLIQHALSAKNIGAEILQFEPYWYFFYNGEAKFQVFFLEIMLTQSKDNNLFFGWPSYIPPYYIPP